MEGLQPGGAVTDTGKAHLTTKPSARQLPSLEVGFSVGERPDVGVAKGLTFEFFLRTMSVSLFGFLLLKFVH